MTITEGTNRLVPSDRARIGRAVTEVLAARASGAFQPRQPEGWDGRAAERVIMALTDTL